MDRSGKNDPKLSEVKAVLQRLQGFSAEAVSVGRPSARSDPRDARRATAIGAAIILVTVAGIFGVALYIGFNGSIDRPPVSNAAGPVATPSDAASAPLGTTAPSVPAADTAPPLVAAPLPPRTDVAKASALKADLGSARVLMAKGQVRAARERLLAVADQGSPDVAWDLARSYDPNVLKALPSADAPPDIEEATRWYRAWYAAAVRDGLVADSVPLERIIGSMRR
jgi:hypothetical protein